MLEYEVNIPEWGGGVVIACEMFDMLVNGVTKDGHVTDGG